MSFSISGKGALALLGCAALTLSVAGCSSSSSTASHASTAAADPDAGLPTGAQLKADLLSTGLPTGYAGYGSVSFAQNDYVDQDTSEEFAQEIDAFQGTTAQAVMTALTDITAKCPTYKDSQTDSTVKVSVATSASPEDGAVVITRSDPAWEGATTLEAIRVGHSVVTVLSTANSGSGALAKLTASQIAGRLSAAGSK